MVELEGKNTYKTTTLQNKMKQDKYGLWVMSMFHSDALNKLTFVTWYHCKKYMCVSLYFSFLGSVFVCF